MPQVLNSLAPLMLLWLKGQSGVEEVDPSDLLNRVLIVAQHLQYGVQKEDAEILQELRSFGLAFYLMHMISCKQKVKISTYDAR